MASLTHEGAGITAMAAAVPRRVVDSYKYIQYFPEDQVKEVADRIEIYECRFADVDTYSSDLCLATAEKLIEDNRISKEEIDLLVFISQTPDYRMPATSVILQDRLKLSYSCVAFGISLGCSAFCYGLSAVYGMVQSGGIRKTLILDGETRSKVYLPRDHRSAFLLEDGGVVVLVERDERSGKSYFSLNSGGFQADLIMIKDGRYQHSSSKETLREKVVDEYGNIRSDEQRHMQGGDVFNFVVREIPHDIKKTLEYAGDTVNSFNYIVLRQASSFINAYIAREMKLGPDKISSTIAKYGNTSSVSLPLTIISELEDKLYSKKKLLLNALGVGMAWTTDIVPFVDRRISDIAEI